VDHIGDFKNRAHCSSLLSFLLRWIKLIEWRKRTLSSGFSYMQVYHSGLDVSVAQEFFNRNDIQSLFQQMGSISMPQGMDGHLFFDARFFSGFANDPLRATR
jgi:hypothetical protein